MKRNGTAPPSPPSFFQLGQCLRHLTEEKEEVCMNSTEVTPLMFFCKFAKRKKITLYSFQEDNVWVKKCICRFQYGR